MTARFLALQGRRLASPQCADTIRIARGRGSARAHPFSWTTQSGSSTSGGAPCPR
jgi:hypothetical protein